MCDICGGQHYSEVGGVSLCKPCNVLFLKWVNKRKHIVSIDLYDVFHKDNQDSDELNQWNREGLAELARHAEDIADGSAVVLYDDSYYDKHGHFIVNLVRSLYVLPAHNYVHEYVADVLSRMPEYIKNSRPLRFSNKRRA